MKDQDYNAKDSTWTPCNFSFIYSLMHLFKTYLLFIYNMLDTVLDIIDIKMNKTMFYALKGLNPSEVHK